MSSLGRFVHYNSNVRVGEDVLRYAVSVSWTSVMSGWVRVYLVNESTIDAHCPAERRVGVPRGAVDRVRRVLGEFFVGGRRVARRVVDEIDVLSEGYAVMGCFVPSGFGGERGPVILVCPERVADAARRVASEVGVGVEEAFRLVFRTVLSHEEGHVLAWLLSGGFSARVYRGLAGRVLEEAVAQLVAYSNPRPGEESVYRVVLTALSRLQPLEYSAWMPLCAVLGGDQSAAYRALLSYAILAAMASSVPKLDPAYKSAMLTAAVMGWDRFVAPALSAHALHTVMWTNHMSDLFYHNIVEPAIAGLDSPQRVLEHLALALLYLTTLTVQP